MKSGRLPTTTHPFDRGWMPHATITLILLGLIVSYFSFSLGLFQQMMCRMVTMCWYHGTTFIDQLLSSIYDLFKSITVRMESFCVSTAKTSTSHPSHIRYKPPSHNRKRAGTGRYLYKLWSQSRVSLTRDGLVHLTPSHQCCSGVHSKTKLFPFRFREWHCHVATPDPPPTPHLGYAFVRFLANHNPLSGVSGGLTVNPCPPRSGTSPSSSSLSAKSRSDSKIRSGEHVNKSRSGSKLRSGSKSKNDIKIRSGEKGSKTSVTAKRKSKKKIHQEHKVIQKSSAGHPSHRLYLDSGASVHILFCKEIMGKLHKLKTPLEISGADSTIHLKQYGSLHKAFQHLPLPTKELYYEPDAIANLLSFAKLADEYYIVCNTRVDDAIYVQNKTDGKYLRFQRCRRNNLYYMDIGQGEPDGYCHFSTVKKGKLKFSMMDQKRAKAVRLLQEQCGFPSDEDFINALECNVISGVDFGRRDIKIANKIYGYSTGASKGKMKHPRKGQRMDRTSDDVTTPVPQSILKHYKNMHLDMDILFVNGIAFFLTISRDIGFIHCKPVVSKHNKQVQDALKGIVADYKSQGFRVKTAFGNNAFEPL